MYSLMPTADRGKSSSTAVPNAGGLGIQQAEAVPARPSAGALILASFDGVDSCGAATNHMGGQFAAVVTLTCAIPARNTPHAFEHADARGALTHWSVVDDDRLGEGERVDE